VCPDRFGKSVIGARRNAESPNCYLRKRLWLVVTATPLQTNRHQAVARDCAARGCECPPALRTTETVAAESPRAKHLPGLHNNPLVPESEGAGAKITPTKVQSSASASSPKSAKSSAAPKTVANKGSSRSTGAQSSDD
jgi:hypothetical protein